MQTYGFDKISIQKLDENLMPVADSEVVVIDGTPKKGAAASFEITGLTKEPVKVFGSNLAYFLARKGYGQVAANLGILDVPSATEHDMMGHTTNGETGKVYHVGEKTEPPYYAVLIESKDLYGVPIGFGMYAGTFSRDGYSGETLNDDDFTPEPGEYVYTPISKKIGDENVIVGFADDAESLTELKTELFGTPAGE